MKFGVQAAIQGLKFDFSTITSKILSKNIYIKAMIIPTAKFKPIPPLFLKEDTDTAIIVKILQCSANNNDLWTPENKELINKV